MSLLYSPVASLAGDMPEADGAVLWKYITEDSPYSKWDHWPGLPGIYKGTPPHGAYLQVFLNKPALDAARNGKLMPAGSIVVKENYGPDKVTLMAVTLMYKVEGYNPAGDDWFWAKHKGDGSVEKEGRVKGCIGCHGAVKDTNWIFNKIK
jgi:hypothetical protein